MSTNRSPTIKPEREHAVQILKQEVADVASTDKSNSWDNSYFVLISRRDNGIGDANCMGVICANSGVSWNGFSQGAKARSPLPSLSLIPSCPFLPIPSPSFSRKSGQSPQWMRSAGINPGKFVKFNVRFSILVHFGDESVTFRFFSFVKIFVGAADARQAVPLDTPPHGANC